MRQLLPLQPLLLLLLPLLLQLVAASDPIEVDRVSRVVTIGDGDGTPVVRYDGFNYLVLASKQLRLGSNYTIGVAVRDSGGLKSATATLRTTKKGDEFASLELRASAAASATSRLGQWTELTVRESYVAGRYDPNGKYQLTVEIEDAAGRRFSNSSEIQVLAPSAATLIQTDKAVYQPGQAVKYRVVTVDAAFRPMLLDTEVTIKDALGNLVYRQIYSTTNASEPRTADATVSVGELPLSELPNEGSWTIEAETSFGKKSKSFQVYRYALPKFSLEVEKPSFVHLNDTSFTVTASVSYTYAKSVEGTFKVKMGPYNSCRGCKPRYDSQQEFEVPAEDGDNEFTFDMTAWRAALPGLEGWYGSIYSYNAKAEVTFVERFTGVNVTETVQFSIYSKKYAVKISTDTPFFLPGFVVPLAVTLQRPDNEAFTESTDSVVTVTLSYKRRGKPQSLRVYQGGVTAASNGTGVTVMARVPTDADFSSIEFQASLSDDASTDSATVVPYLAVADDYVTADFVSNEDKLQMQFGRSSGIRMAYVATLSRSQLQWWSQIGVETSDESTVDWRGGDCSGAAGLLPAATVLVLGVTGDGEFVAATAEKKLTNCLPNITLTTNLEGNTGRPKQMANIEVQALPDSYVFLTGIDQSVNLIRTGQDILRSSLLSAGSGVTYSRWRPRPNSVSAGKLLRDNNLMLLTDGSYFNGRSRSLYAARAGPQYESATSADSAGAGGGGGGDSVARDFFPETMVWSVVKTGSSGRAQQWLQLADTMTAWDVTAFGVSSGAPLQTMSEAMQVVTRQPFFLQPQLPATVVRGERFILKVVAMNFAGAPGSVNVTLRVNSSEFTATPLGGGRTWRGDGIVGVWIPSGGDGDGSAGMATFELVPTGVGEMTLPLRGELQVKRLARLTQHYDVVSRQLLVVPEGETIRRTSALLLSLSGSATGRIGVEFPTSERLVAGSQAVTYHLLGDVLGPAMANLRQLVRMPSGCGEQNLVHFAPAVSVANYLTAVGRSDEPAMLKAVKAMQTGYQRQLTYRRRDGAFSAFGDSDVAGSVWLTAFALRVFARAANFVAIDAASLSGRSLQFVLRHQAANGEFTEPPGGRVFDSRLQGGAGSGSVAMTASICASLLDVAKAAAVRSELRATLLKDRLDLQGGVAKCLRFLASQPTDVEESLDSMSLSLSLYALQLAETSGLATGVGAGLSAARNRLRRRLRAAGVEADGGIHWQLPTSWGGQRSSVEATAYALMYSVMADQRPDLRILRWLVAQQQDNGGFGTTQATVVAIRALTDFAVKVSLDRRQRTAANVTISTAAGATTATTADFFVNETNKFVLQSRVVARGAAAADLREVAVAARGSGLLLLTVAWQYNMRDLPDLQLGAEWLHRQGLALRLGESKVHSPAAGGFGFEICASSNLTEGMYILTVANPTGFSPAGQTAPRQVAGLQRVEAGDQQIVFYFDSLSSAVCVQAQWQRDLPVLNTSPVRVQLRKYYTEDDSLTVVYSPPELRGLTRCGVCLDCPGCERPSAMRRQ